MNGFDARGTANPKGALKPTTRIVDFFKSVQVCDATMLTKRLSAGNKKNFKFRSTKV